VSRQDGRRNNPSGDVCRSVHFETRRTRRVIVSSAILCTHVSVRVPPVPDCIFVEADANADRYVETLDESNGEIRFKGTQRDYAQEM